MSAFIVGRNHIHVLVEALFHYEVYPFQEDATALGQELWNENILSVQTRYPGESLSELPGPCDETYQYVWEPDEKRTALVRDPVQVLCLCQSYDYQSCEHDTWEDSDSFRLMEALREACLKRLGKTMEQVRRSAAWDKAHWTL